MKVEKKFQLKENGKKAVDKWDVIMLKLPSLGITNKNAIKIEH